jgi:hypothetical protein
MNEERKNDEKNTYLRGCANNLGNATKRAPFICSAHSKTPLLFNVVYLPKCHINFTRGRVSGMVRRCEGGGVPAGNNYQQSV